MRHLSLPLIALCATVTTGCAPEEEMGTLAGLETALRQEITASGAEVGFFYRSLGPDGDSLLLSPDLRMHAASTMKVPVMMQLYLDHQNGLRSLDSAVEVKSTFASIVDGSTFELPADSDSDSTTGASSLLLECDLKKALRASVKYCEYFEKLNQIRLASS